MTVFFGDSLQQQIERGEVGYYLWESQSPVAGGQVQLSAVTTLTKQLSMFLNVQSQGTFKIELKKDVASFAGGIIITGLNMNFNSMEGIDVLIYRNVSSTGGASGGGTAYYMDGNPSTITPFSLESGIILEPNTHYVFAFYNYGPGKAYPVYTAFLREVS